MADARSWTYNLSTVSFGLAALAPSVTPSSAFTVTGGRGGVEVSRPVIDQRYVDQAITLSESRADAKVADLKGEMKLASQGLGELKDRFNDLSSKMASVPSDIAAMKRDIAHLPSKEELGAKLRNYLTTAVAILSLIIGLATFIIRNAGA